jgi:two-component system chemotaxis response regulator CheB
MRAVQAPELIAIGASLGGFSAVRTVLEALPTDLGCSVVIVQHRAADPDSRLVELLARHSAMPVIEPEDKAPIEPNHVYLAPSDYHLQVERGTFSLSVDPPQLFARPSIDVLFESVADAYGPVAVAVILTGSNEDGAAGAVAIKRAGGKVIVQDPKTAESGVAPRAVLARVVADMVVPLESIAAELAKCCVPCKPGGGPLKPRTRWDVA